MNVRDSESVEAMLLERGLERAELESDADIFIVNTCSVRGKAEDKALGKLGVMVKEKQNSTVKIIGVMGCMAQRLQDDVFKKVKGLDFAIGTYCFSKIYDVIEEVKSGYGPVLEVGENNDAENALTGHTAGASSAFVNILFGCNRRCSFCVVPHVRGRERSRTGASILSEVKCIAGDGIREVTLLGQSVMAYGKSGDVWLADYQSPRGYLEPLPRLLEAVSGIDGIKRVRFTSGHPCGCTDELVKSMAELPEVCEYMHIPLQSASDRILKLMRRGYTLEEYRAAVDKLRNAMPDIALSTDIIVGFPTESSDDFLATRQFMEEIRFDNAFIFKYSPRPGTSAAEMEDDVDAVEKLTRNKLLLDDQDRRSMIVNRGLVGSSVQVMAEGVSLRNTERWSGRTRTNKIVVFEPVDGMKEGDLVQVCIERAMAQTVYGRIVKD